MKKEEMIMHYIYVKSVHLENELINHENYMETIRPDASDYLEQHQSICPSGNVLGDSAGHPYDPTNENIEAIIQNGYFV